MTKNNIEINIYGGNVQVLPNVKEVEQNIYTKDGKTTIINKFKYDSVHKAQSTSSSADGDCYGLSRQDD